MRYFSILALCFVFYINGVAQKTKPLGGSITFQRYGGIPGVIALCDINVNILFRYGDSIPDSINVRWSGALPQYQRHPRTNIQINCDSTVIVSYTKHYEFTYPSIGEYILAYFDSNYVFDGESRVPVKEFWLLSEVHANTPCAFGPEIGLREIHIRPDEDFRGNLYERDKERGDSIAFLNMAMPAKPPYFIKDSTFYVQSRSGDILWNAPHATGKYTRALSYRYNDGHYESYPLVTFIVDSTVSGYFKLDEAHIDSNGLLGYQLTSADTVRCVFYYIDSDADQVTYDWFTTFDRYDTVVPWIYASRSGDTLQFDFRAHVSSKMLAHAPGSFSLVIHSYKSGRACYNRHLSFYVNNALNAGLPHETGTEGFSIYPNPVGELLFVNAVRSVKGLHYRLHDNLGRTVSTGIYTGSVDVGNLEPGVYLIYLENSQTGGNALKFIKD